MVNNYFNLSYLLPFKFVPATPTPGKHFDDSWACEQIKEWQANIKYFQKWERADTTVLQCEANAKPQPLKVLDILGNTVKEIEWGSAFDNGLNQKIWELIFTMADVPVDGNYVLYQVASFLGIEFRAIAEPFTLKDSHPGTKWIQYKHAFNDYGIAFTTGAEFGFRIECDLVDYTPRRVRTSFVDQPHNTETLHGEAYRSYTFQVGQPNGHGVAPWAIDLLNRIWLCSSIRVDGKLYQAEDGSKDMEIVRAERYPLLWASLPVVEQHNNDSLSFHDDQNVAPGFVVAYNIDTNVFGAGTSIPITDIEQQ